MVSHFKSSLETAERSAVKSSRSYSSIPLKKVTLHQTWCCCKTCITLSARWKAGLEGIFLIFITGLVWSFAVHLHYASILPESQVHWDHRDNHTLLHSFKKNFSTHHDSNDVNWSEDNAKSFVFLQISDVHVSRFRSKGGIAHLNVFLSHHVPLFAPEVVLVTGDLTDAKTRSTLKSVQYPDEWIAYHESLLSSGVLRRRNGTFWLDQRGNHDCFNVESFSSTANYFKHHSAVKREGYIVHVEKPFGKYTFAATDACPKYGASRPLNFFGYVDSDDMDTLEEAIQTAHNNKHNHTFIMSHYPTGTTTFGRSSKGLFFEDISSHITLWLCGHLHKLAGGLGETMYAFQRNGYLELELGDLKSHGLYRIVVVDNDLISFVDIPLTTSGVKQSRNKMNINKEAATTSKEMIQLSHRVTGKVPIYMPKPLTPPPLLLQKDSNDTFSAHQKLHEIHSDFPPIVLITNPKDARFAIPGKEPLHLIAQSSHIRVFVWTRNEILSWKLELDGHEISLDQARPIYKGQGTPWGPIDEIENESSYLPLWIIPWDPKDVLRNETSPGQNHVLKVTVTDSNGQSGQHLVQFRLDGTRNEKMDAGPGGFIISIPLSLIIKDLTIIGYVILTIGCLLVPRLFVLSLSFRSSLQKNETKQSLLAKNQQFLDHSAYFAWVKRLSSQLVAIDHDEHVFEKLIPVSEKTVIDFMYYRLQDFVYTCKATFLRFCELSRHPNLFWPLYGYLLYMSVGPLLIGDFIPSARLESQAEDINNEGPVESNLHRYAWLMVYGLWFETGEWVPSADTWLFAFHGLAYSTFPLVFYLSFCVTCPSWLYCDLNRRLTQPIHERWYVRIGVIFVILYHIFDTLGLGFFYGHWALFVSPSRTWILLWGCLVLWKWRNGPDDDPIHPEDGVDESDSARKSTSGITDNKPSSHGQRKHQPESVQAENTVPTPPSSPYYLRSRKQK